MRRWLGALTIMAIVAVFGAVRLPPMPSQAAVASRLPLPASLKAAPQIDPRRRPVLNTVRPVAVPKPVAPLPVVSSAPAPAPAPRPAPAAPAVFDPQAEGQAALARIHYPYQRLGYAIAFHGPLTGFLGLTDCSSHHVDVYIRPSETADQVAFVTAFELAHAVDCGFNTTATRSAWASIRGFPGGATWFPSCTCSEDEFGSGDFSDVFATWLVGSGGWPWRSRLAPPPSSSELSALMPYLLPAAIAG